ncbi:MAG: hypothetical protein ACP5I1_08845 [Candidatus Hinthialibacter sp.]
MDDFPFKDETVWPSIQGIVSRYWPKWDRCRKDQFAADVWRIIEQTHYCAGDAICVALRTVEGK